MLLKTIFVFGLWKVFYFNLELISLIESLYPTTTLYTALESANILNANAPYNNIPLNLEFKYFTHHFVMVQDASGYFKPLIVREYKEAKWPVLDLNAGIGRCAMGVYGSVTSGKGIPMGFNILPRGITKEVGANGKVFYNKPGTFNLIIGFCENCQIKYTSYNEHILSKSHNKYRQADSNFFEIDQLIENLSRPKPYRHIRPMEYIDPVQVQDLIPEPEMELIQPEKEKENHVIQFFNGIMHDVDIDPCKDPKEFAQVISKILIDRAENLPKPDSENQDFNSFSIAQSPSFKKCIVLFNI